MAWVESLQRAIDYMEDHLSEDITIEEIAKQAHSSPFHFQRTFTLLTDITIGDYLRRRRLSLAAKELTGTDTKIIDLACKYGPRRKRGKGSGNCNFITAWSSR